MKPRQLQKLVHDLGYTTVTAKNPNGYYAILTDLSEKQACSSKQAIDTIKKLSFAITALLDPGIFTNCNEEWVGELYIYEIHDKNGGIILYSFLLNTQTQVLTINNYNV